MLLSVDLLILQKIPGIYFSSNEQAAIQKTRTPPEAIVVADVDFHGGRAKEVNKYEDIDWTWDVYHEVLRFGECQFQTLSDIQF